MSVPRSHPRYGSLVQRERLIECSKRDITHISGLIAHGRGEAFDYLIGEVTPEPSLEATEAATAMLLAAEYPVLSINGNVAALVPDEIVRLSNIIDAPIEVNLFHRTKERVQRIRELLTEYGAKKILTGENAFIPEIEHDRGVIDKSGIYAADTVLTPLEDGDRCRALVEMGKKVISIDLNPLSRTSQFATIPIVDNITRVVPNMISLSIAMKRMTKASLLEIIENFDVNKNRRAVLNFINRRLNALAESPIS